MPSLFIATTEFRDGAKSQARALGADPVALYVEHPIQDRTDAEMAEIADRALEPLLELMTSGSPTPPK